MIASKPSDGFFAIQFEGSLCELKARIIHLQWKLHCFQEGILEIHIRRFALAASGGLIFGAKCQPMKPQWKPCFLNTKGMAWTLFSEKKLLNISPPTNQLTMVSSEESSRKLDQQQLP